MEQLELEGIAEAILREGGQTDDEAPKLVALVTKLLGVGALEYSDSTPGDAALVRVYSDWRIYVRRRLPLPRLLFAIAHELFEWWMRVVEGYIGSDIEHCANGGGAALITPRRAFRRATSSVGRDFAALAHLFRVTETHVALREAELDRLPRAVVSPALVRIRGPEAWVWPDEATVRRWARHAPAQVRKTKLTDDPRRVVLDAEMLDVG